MQNSRAEGGVQKPDKEQTTLEGKKKKSTDKIHLSEFAGRWKNHRNTGTDRGQGQVSHIQHFITNEYRH